MASKLVERVLHVGEEEQQPEDFKAQVSDKKGRRKKEDVRQGLLNLLFANNCEVLEEFCKYGASTEVTPVAMALVVLMQQNGRVEGLLKRLLTWKLNLAAQVNAAEVTNLLRDNTLPVMLLMAFAQVEGAEFLRGTFYQPLQVIIADTEPIELNPANQPNPDIVAASIARIEKYCNLVVDTLKSSKTLVPAGFKRLCQYIRKEVERVLPEGTPAADDTSAGLSPALKILGAFLMLRLIIPLITSPEKMGLLDEPSAPGSEPVYRNTLKIVAKVLTTLCNGVEYGQKELHLVPLNGFLGQRKHFMKEILTFMSEPSQEEMDAVTRPKMFSPAVFDSACNYLAAYVQQAIPRIEKKMETAPQEMAVELLDDRIDRLRLLLDMGSSGLSGTVRAKFKALTVRGGNDKKLLGGGTVGRNDPLATGPNGGHMKKSTSAGSLGHSTGNTFLTSVDDDIGPAPVMSATQRNALIARAKGLSALNLAEDPVRRGSILPGQGLFEKRAALAHSTTTPALISASEPSSPMTAVSLDPRAIEFTREAHPPAVAAGVVGPPPASASMAAAAAVPAVAAATGTGASGQPGPHRDRNFSRQSLVAFRGAIHVYVRQLGAFQGAQVVDCWPIIVPYLTYVWEVLCREAMQCAVKSGSTSVVLLSDMDKAVSMSVPPIVATSSKSPLPAGFDKQCFHDKDMQRDFSKFLASSPELVAQFKLTQALSLDLSAAARMASVLEFILVTVFLNALKYLKGSRSVVRPADVTLALGADRGLVQLATMMVNSEVIGRQVYSPLPEVVKGVVANPLVSPAANAGQPSTFSKFFSRKADKPATEKEEKKDKKGRDRSGSVGDKSKPEDTPVITKPPTSVPQIPTAAPSAAAAPAAAAAAAASASGGIGQPLVGQQALTGALAGLKTTAVGGSTASLPPPVATKPKLPLPLPTGAAGASSTGAAAVPPAIAATHKPAGHTAVLPVSSQATPADPTKKPGFNYIY